MRKSECGFIEVLYVIIIMVVILILTWIGSTLYTMIKEEEAYGSKQGQIIDKDYHAAYTSVIYYSNKIMIPQHHPASYRVRIQKDIDGELKSIWIDVDEKTYHEINIGDYYNKEE